MNVKLRRFFAYLIDWCIIAFSLKVYSYLFSLLLIWIANNFFGDQMLKLASLIVVLSMFLWPFLFSGVIGGLLKNSIGKMFMGLVVVGQNGVELTFVRAALREAFRIYETPMFFISILSLYNIINDKMSLHDMVLGTDVVRRNK